MAEHDCFHGDLGGLPAGGSWSGTGGVDDFHVLPRQERNPVGAEHSITVEQRDDLGTSSFEVREAYTASDGEICALSVTVTGSGLTPQEAAARGQEYFALYGRRMVEDAKRAGQWPPSDDDG